MSNSPLLGRCKHKGCDYAIFATREQVKPADSFREVTAGTGVYRVGNDGHFARCSNGHKFFVLREVKGTYSDVHKCDSRCLNAKGHECTCSCGGMNHGRGYAVEVHEVPSTDNVIVTKTDEEITERQEAFLRTLLNERVIPDVMQRDELVTGEFRKQRALNMLDNGGFNKRQASKTIEWLLSLPKENEYV